MDSAPARPVERITGLTAAPLDLYVRAVIACGALAVAWSTGSLPRTPAPLQCLFFSVLAVFTGSFTVKIAAISAQMAVGDTFFVTTALLFGPAPATVALAIGSLWMSWWRGHSAMRVAFNAASTALSLWVAAHLFFALAGVGPLAHDHSPIGSIVAPLLILTLAYFALNSWLTAIAVALEKKRSAVEVWRQHFAWLAVNYVGAGSAALCLIFLLQQIGFTAVAIILPLLLIFHLTLRSSFGRLEDAEQHLAEKDRLYVSTVETLAMAIDAKDDVTHSHVRRVQAYAVGLAKELGVVDELTLKAIEAAALLHDTGKLAIPEHILNKPGKLNAAEFETMKLHVDVGADILSLVDFPYPVVPIVRCHHENWNGSGYPRGTAGEDIPIGARILSVVDCFDALTSDRPYRPRMTVETAFDILRERAGLMYDPRVVDAFIRVQPRIAPDDEVAASDRKVMEQIARTRRTHATPAETAPPAAPASASDDVLAFVSLARLASGERSVSDVLALASTLLRDASSGATTIWYMLDALRPELVVAHATGPEAHAFRGVTMSLGTRVSGWVGATRQPIVNADPLLDVGAPGSSLRSAVSVPLTSGDALVGVLTIYSPQPNAFTDDHGRLLQMIAPHVASALSRARAAAADPAIPGSDRTGAAGTALRLVANR